MYQLIDKDVFEKERTETWLLLLLLLLGQRTDGRTVIPARGGIIKEPRLFFRPRKTSADFLPRSFCVRNSIGIQPVAPPTPNVQENKGERLVKGQSLEALKENERGKI